MFEIVNGKLEILPEALTFPAIRKVYDRDKSKTKETAKTQLAFMYHMCNRHSSLFEVKEDKKHDTIMMFLFPSGTDWEPIKDDLFFRCTEIYKRILGYSVKHFALDCAKEGMYIIGEKMKDDSSKINNIQSAMRSLDDAFDDFDNLKKKADRDEIESGVSKIKGNVRLGKRQQ